MAILIALQQGPATAQSLADKLEVSRRTILRDMQSLAEMGIPLYAVTGPAGGFRLMEGFLMPPLQLDPQEALTVLLSLRAMAKMADTPFKRARWTVIDKIKAILPEQTLRQIEPMLGHVDVQVPERRVKTPHLSALLEYAADDRWLRTLYRSENHRRWLQIRPKRVYMAHGFWYCEAHSVEHGETRTFRVDRFETVEASEAPGGEASAEGPDRADGETEAHWEPVRIVARLTYRGALLAEQDEHIGELVKQLSDDEWEIDFICPASERAWAVRFFYMLGMNAEVLEPAALREELYALADQMCGRYRTGKGK